MPRRPMEGRRHAHVITDRRYTGSIPVGGINTINLFFDENIIPIYRILLYMGEPYQHSLTLQRLGTYLSNDGKQVFYTPEAFTNTETWTNIPVIFAESVAGMPN